MYIIDGNFFYSSLNFFLVLDDDDVVVFDFIVRLGGDFSWFCFIIGLFVRED